MTIPPGRSAKGAEVILTVRDADRDQKVAAALRAARPTAGVEDRELDLTRVWY